ncbi:hypothetical protein HRR83_000694 [Exophiala dermatitidis]|uniref:Uncharacterized protein n=1 Tax=Exophiala dermatitidis TaxID=5970 RepID=A0AAN6IYD2_EXODE|nr:hypothetical protein HRR75_000633 [Exophiala dermatitidis]KAJ4527942.1 hypothetical protein HRR74_000697 [Exophiala dermatitidis]KAJ4528576.1 hypothetical protein HRR73_001199 [Exophiala dermatitidis]KAJ4529948.1 hypothetical protein HRR76_009195 [Exophiala dermatitidis]KAJ4552929.1 hypothetical protein HRR78_003188 [Exophiala dermatitidis]
MDRFMRARRVKYLPAKERLSGLTDLHDDLQELERLGDKFERAVNTLCSRVRSRSTHYRRKRSLSRFQQAYEKVDKTLLVFLVARWGGYILDIISDYHWAEFDDHYRSLLTNYPRLPEVGRVICEKYKSNIESLLHTAAKLTECEAEESTPSQRPPRVRASSELSQQESSEGSPGDQVAHGAQNCLFPPHTDILRSDGTAITVLNASNAEAVRTKTLDLLPPKHTQFAITPTSEDSNRASDLLDTFSQMQQSTRTVAACVGNEYGYPMAAQIQDEGALAYANAAQQQNVVQQGTAFLHSLVGRNCAQRDAVNQAVNNITPRGNPDASAASMNFQMQQIEQNHTIFPLLKVLLILSNITTDTVAESNDGGISISKVRLLNAGEVIGIIEVGPLMSRVLTEHI